jgi:hypothetical protein
MGDGAILRLHGEKSWESWGGYEVIFTYDVSLFL